MNRAVKATATHESPKRGPSERSKLRRAQILDAARHCFARVGFHSTSMAQIAAQAQMSVGQIYRHFRSKESLIEGIVQADIAQQLAFLEGPPAQRLLDALAAASSGTAPAPAYRIPSIWR